MRGWGMGWLLGLPIAINMLLIVTYNVVYAVFVGCIFPQVILKHYFCRVQRSAPTHKNRLTSWKCPMHGAASCKQQKFSEVNWEEEEAVPAKKLLIKKKTSKTPYGR